MANLFFSEDIFESDGDYVIGGLYLDEGESFTYTKLYDSIEKKIARLYDEFISESMNNCLQFDKPFSLEECKYSLSLLIKDMLKVSPVSIEKDFVVEAIMKSEQMIDWLEVTMKSRIENSILVNKNLPESQYSVSEKTKQSEEYQSAKEFTDNTTLRTLIEQLSLIEL